MDTPDIDDCLKRIRVLEREVEKLKQSNPQRLGPSYIPFQSTHNDMKLIEIKQMGELWVAYSEYYNISIIGDTPINVFNNISELILKRLQAQYNDKS